MGDTQTFLFQVAWILVSPFNSAEYLKAKDIFEKKMTSSRSMKQIDLQFLKAVTKSGQVPLELELSYPFLFPFQLQSIRSFVLCKKKKKKDLREN